MVVVEVVFPPVDYKVLMVVILLTGLNEMLVEVTLTTPLIITRDIPLASCPVIALSLVEVVLKDFLKET